LPDLLSVANNVPRHRAIASYFSGKPPKMIRNQVF
jgi:hypothetical protein